MNLKFVLNPEERFITCIVIVLLLKEEMYEIFEQIIGSCHYYSKVSVLVHLTVTASKVLKFSEKFPQVIPRHCAYGGIFSISAKPNRGMIFTFETFIISVHLNSSLPPANTHVTENCYMWANVSRFGKMATASEVWATYLLNFGCSISKYFKAGPISFPIEVNSLNQPKQFLKSSWTLCPDGNRMKIVH